MVKILAVVLSVALGDAGVMDAGEPDAGEPIVPFASPIYGSCPDARDAGRAVRVDGGWLLPDPRGPRQACLLEACESDRKSKEDQLKNAPVPPAWLAISISVGLVGAAFAAGLAWGRLGR